MFRLRFVGSATPCFAFRTASNLVCVRSKSTTIQSLPRVPYKPYRTRTLWKLEEDKELIRLRQAGQTWRHIAKALRRNNSACCQHYDSLQNPPSRMGKWTKQEDESLLTALNQAEANETKHWRSRFSRQLGRCRRSVHSRLYVLRPGLKKGPFSDEERKQFAEYVYDRQQSGLPISWKELGGILRRRSHSVRSMWLRQCTGPKTGRWTPEDDQLLLERAMDAISVGKKPGWVKIAQALDRNSDSVRKRWVNRVNPCLKSGRWTAAEVNKLRKLVQTLAKGGNIPWASIATELKRGPCGIHKKYLALKRSNRL